VNLFLWRRFSKSGGEGEKNKKDREKIAITKKSIVTKSDTQRTKLSREKFFGSNTESASISCGGERETVPQRWKKPWKAKAKKTIRGAKTSCNLMGKEELASASYYLFLKEGVPVLRGRRGEDC